MATNLITMEGGGLGFVGTAAAIFAARKAAKFAARRLARRLAARRARNLALRYAVNRRTNQRRAEQNRWRWQ